MKEVLLFQINLLQESLETILKVPPDPYPVTTPSVLAVQQFYGHVTDYFINFSFMAFTLKIVRRTWYWMQLVCGSLTPTFPSDYRETTATVITGQCADGCIYGHALLHKCCT